MLVVSLAGCALDGGFYSHRRLAFEPLDGPRAQLAGTWLGPSGATLVLRPNGRHGHGGTAAGCWDADERSLFFLWGCVNYGATRGDPFLAIAEGRYECHYTLGTTLRLSQCPGAGEYRRQSTRD
jgi:hypothetical protein